MSTPPAQLWQIGTKRCTLTPHTADPPYRVVVFDGDTILREHEFQTHDAAVEDAIAELRASSAEYSS
jgi:hypothetical protein